MNRLSPDRFSPVRVWMLALIATAILALAAFVVATPDEAHAATCPGGTACVYTGSNGTGSQGVIPWSTFYPGCHALSSPFYENTWSAWVGYGSGYGLKLWSGSFCQASSQYIVGPLANTGHIHNITSPWSVNMRSFCITPPGSNQC